MKTFTADFLRPGSQQSARVSLPTKGPWIVLGQNDPPIVGQLWRDAVFVASREGKLVDVLDLSIGHVIYHESKDGLAEITASHYDTSG